MTFNIINRRTHLYLGLALLPWVFVYGLSSITFSHGPLINPLFKDGIPAWTKKSEQEYDRPVPENADLREVATEILREFGLRESFFVTRPKPNRMNIVKRGFLSSTRLTYFIDEKRLLVEDRRPVRLNTLLTGLHLRGGYQQGLFLDDLWAFVLDLVCIGFVLWVASGIYMWWKLRQTRFWGGLALAGGFLCFGWFLMAL